VELAAITIEPQPPSSEADEPAQSPQPTVSITIRSIPEGAGVFLEDETEPRGVTPFTTEMTRVEDGELTFRLEAPGYAPLIQGVSLERDSQLAVVLAKAEAQSAAKGRKPSSRRTSSAQSSPRREPPTTKKPGYREGAVMNPFE
jgi:hypothetical protein